MNYSIYKMHKIKDICNVSSSKRIYASEYVDEGIAFWRSKEVIQKANNEEISDVLYITKDRFEEIKMKFGAPKKGDILLASIGANMGTSYYVNIDTDFYFKDGNVTWFSNFSENINSMYLYFCLNWNIVKTNMLNRAIGSAQKALTIESLKKLEIPLPSIEEQKAIAKILSDLDKKIEINNKTNKKLEEMAKAIFKQWFVDFEFPNEKGEPYKSSGGEMIESELGIIPNGWEYKKLDDVLTTIEAGNRPKGGVGNLTEGIPSIGAENIIGLGKYDYSKEKFVTEEYFNTMKKGIVQSKDVLLYKDGAQLGRKTMFMDGFPHKKCCINSHVFILRSNNDISQSYLYFWLDQDYMTQNIINLNANSAQPGINQVQVKTLRILVPNKEIIVRFELAVNSLLEKIFSNCLENNNLIKLRDTLLPKLMSGEIRVPLNNEEN